MKQAAVINIQPPVLSWLRMVSVALLVFRYTWLIEHDYPEDIRRARLQTQWVCKSGIGRTAPAES